MNFCKINVLKVFLKKFPVTRKITSDKRSYVIWNVRKCPITIKKRRMAFYGRLGRTKPERIANKMLSFQENRKHKRCGWKTSTWIQKSVWPRSKIQKTQTRIVRKLRRWRIYLSISEREHKKWDSLEKNDQEEAGERKSAGEKENQEGNEGS